MTSFTPSNKTKYCFWYFLFLEYLYVLQYHLLFRIKLLDFQIKVSQTLLWSGRPHTTDSQITILECCQIFVLKIKQLLVIPKLILKEVIENVLFMVLCTCAYDILVA